MKLRTSSIKSKILTAVYTVLIPLLLLSALSIYFYVNDILSRQIISETQAYESKICQQISTCLNETVNYSKSVMVDPQVQKYMEIIDSSQSQDYQYFSTLYKLQNTLRTYVEMQNSTVDDIYMLGNTGNALTIPDYGDTRSEQWYSDFESTGMANGFTEFHKSPGDQVSFNTDVTSYISNVYDVNQVGKSLGKIIINLKSSSITQPIEVKNRPFQTVLLFNDGKLFYRVGVADESVIDSIIMPSVKTNSTGIVKDGSSYYFMQPVQGSNWYIAGILSRANLNMQLQKSFALFLILVFICITLISIVLIPVINNITHPLSMLAAAMHEVSKVKLDMEIKINSNDEIEYLANVFNDMVKDIKKNMEDSIREEKWEQQMKLQLLMAQINPHFIYNTLDTIIYLARSKDYKNIIVVTRAFIEILQLTITNTPETMFTIKQEIDYINNYVLLLKYRYNNLILVKWNVDEKLYNLSIPKMLIYPLVENSIFHGLFPKSGNGEITISMETKNGLINITVEDNGIGMEKERLESVLSRMQSAEIDNPGTHIGIQNVNSRLKLLYSERLNIESIYGKGTKIQFRIPSLSEEKNDETAFADESGNG